MRGRNSPLIHGGLGMRQSVDFTSRGAVAGHPAAGCTHRRRRAVCLLLFALAVFHQACPAAGAAEEPYEARVRPFVIRYCHDCHSGEHAEGDVDLAGLHDQAALARRVRLVQRVEEMVTSGQMPPPEAEQPTTAERAAVGDWLRAFLSAEARVRGGDPGRIVLRRLNNVEYTHTVRDVTGVAVLDPAREFPADGGAGEGFTNTGHSLVMAPSLVAKYLDAAKRIAGHAVLLPDGIAFAAGDSRRDFTDEWISRLKRFYARYTQPLAPTGFPSQTVVRQGITLDLGKEGFLPVEPYVRATLDLRSEPAADAARIASLARERGLSPKYLAMLLQLLAGSAATRDIESPGLGQILSRWRGAAPGEAQAVAAEIGRWQDAVWKFNAVGSIGRHLGRQDGPAVWMEPVSPLVRQHEFRLSLAGAAAGVVPDRVRVHLAAGTAGDGARDDIVIFKAPRLVAAGREDIPLRRIRAYASTLARWRPRVAETAVTGLAAVAEALASGSDGMSDPMAVVLAAKHGVDRRILEGWFAVVGIGGDVPTLDLLPEKLTNGGGWDFIRGWKGPQDIAVIANASDQGVQVPQTMRPHGIVVHPAPHRRVIVGWRSPFTGRVRVDGVVQRAHAVCGNGVSWTLQVRRGRSRLSLARMVADKGSPQRIGPFDAIHVRAGDMICLAVGSRDGNHQCDSTAVDLSVVRCDEEATASASWDLGKDCSGDLLAANPHSDAYGRPNIWYFGSEPDPRDGESVIPHGSFLARWLSATPQDDRGQLAASIGGLLASAAAKQPLDAADVELRRLLTSPTGPLLGTVLRESLREDAADAAGDEDTTVGLDPSLFGAAPEGIAAGAVAGDDLCFRPPHGFTIEIPRELAEGYELVTVATLPAGTPPEASVQAWVGVGPTPSTECAPDVRILVAQPSPAWDRLSASFDAFRQLFPKAVCYARIVPVDEVIPLNLFFREDDNLRRLMLDENESAELDRLWDELLFVAREPLGMADAFEQLLGYASQDRADLVGSFTPMKPVIAARADDFRRRLERVEPRHVDAVVALAGRAFRRPLREDDTARLRGLYAAARKQGLPHEEAITTVLSHVFVSPDFLFKIEEAAPGLSPAPLRDHELATRLSYFLWSSLPDAELAAEAAAGHLQHSESLVSQARRLLAAPASRRLAEEFGMQWLQVYGFSAIDEKNAAIFPTFAGLRADMEEETVRFLDDFFRNDRSVLSLIDADHTFLNERLARHYAIDGVKGEAWQRVDDVRRHGRGGILGLATTLSTQAGASRTSPILRGNWLYETILGEKLPRPPKDVPQLSETVPEGLSERQLIAMHSGNAACARCHLRIDPFGFALEAFDAIGRRRTTDAAGRPLDVRVRLPDGTTVEGQAGLRAYFLGVRRDQFVRVFCRKLLGYALGRSVQLTDEPLLDGMLVELAANEYRVSVAIDAIVTSPQFRTIRGRDQAEEED